MNFVLYPLAFIGLIVVLVGCFVAVSAIVVYWVERKREGMVAVGTFNDWRIEHEAAFHKLEETVAELSTGEKSS